jgi:hypothetical protein
VQAGDGVVGKLSRALDYAERILRWALGELDVSVRRLLGSA